MNGSEFVFNNKTVLILLLLVKAVCGIDWLSFNRILQCMQITVIGFLTGMKMCLTGCLIDISQQLHSYFRVRVCIRAHVHNSQYNLMWHDVAMNSFMFSHDSCLHGTHKCIELWIHLKTQFRLEIQIKYKSK